MTGEKAPSSDEIDIKELFRALWRCKIRIMVLTLLSGFVSLSFALSMPNTYRAEALLAPVQSVTDGFGSLASNYGGLASLAGISLSSGSNDKSVMGVEVLKSRAFFAKFMRDREILVPLMAVKSWIPETNTLVLDEGIYDASEMRWIRGASPPNSVEPSTQEAYEVFSDIFSVTKSKQTGFVTVAIEHVSPHVAERWVTWLVEDVNKAIRDQDVSQAVRSIEYLKQQISGTRLKDLRSGFFDLIQSQTETIMLAKARPEYLFKTIDPAVVSEKKTGPRRAFIVFVGAALGFIAGALFVLIMYLRANV